MNPVLFERLLKDPAALEDVSLAEIETLVSSNPWMGTAHFLLAIKKQQSNTDDANEAIQKAALYYNPLLFSYLINHYAKQKEHIASNETKNALPYAEAENIPKHTPIEQPTVDEIAFEPYHTVDYFASQGIRLKDEPHSNDPLTQQVKSFTQWLRSMKKIYVEQETAMEPVAENEVITKADGSNTITEVITEAMAEVLIKQGKKGQAIQVYDKLSLIYPEKRHYFASLIDTLNTKS